MDPYTDRAPKILKGPSEGGKGSAAFLLLVQIKKQTNFFSDSYQEKDERKIDHGKSDSCACSR